MTGRFAYHARFWSGGGQGDRSTGRNWEIRPISHRLHTLAALVADLVGP